MKRGEAGAGSTLDWLLGPMTGETFFADHYEQASLFLPGLEPQRYSHLLTLEALDAFVSSADLRHDMLRLVSGGDAIDPARYIAPDGRVLPTAVAEAYLRGATIVLPQLHLSLAPVSGFCRGLEAELFAAVQANAYLTPGSERGFAPHYDQHDVFILQISGTKCWTLYDRPASAAGGALFIREVHEPGPVSGQHDLAAGDCLYIPRGLMHEAANEDDTPSLHLTVGILTKSWGDAILDAVAALVREDPAFHRSLPPGYATDPEALKAAAQEFAPLLGRVAKRARLDDTLGRFARDFLMERRPSIAGVLASPSPPERLRRRPMLLWRLTVNPRGLILTGPGGDLHFSASDEAALTMALSGEAFDRARLPSADPARLTERLWANGYLEAVAGNDSGAT